MEFLPWPLQCPVGPGTLSSKFHMKRPTPPPGTPPKEGTSEATSLKTKGFCKALTLIFSLDRPLVPEAEITRPLLQAQAFA